MSTIKEHFGTLADGSDVHLFTMKNDRGVEVKITNYGGIITSVITPDKKRILDEIVLGFDTLDEYLEGHPYFGALVGRYANRIANGRFELNGEIFSLSQNEGENQLHGGFTGFDKVRWNAEILDDDSLKLEYLSPDGEEGYPGNLNVTAIYNLSSDNKLTLTFEAETDQATPVNFTSHSYFNLNGDLSKSILNHELKLHSDFYTPVNNQLIPTGEIRRVAGTPLDFREFKQIGSHISQIEGGYDHNFVIRNDEQKLRIAAEVSEKVSGRKLNIYTTEPGIQFYTGNFLDGSLTSSDGRTSFEKHGAFCLEPQHFPDSPNQPDFPSTILRPGEVFNSTIVYEFLSE